MRQWPISIVTAREHSRDSSEVKYWCLGGVGWVGGGGVVINARDRRKCI